MPDNARPNILWCCTDQQRFDTIGALGNPHVHTPNLDRLVELLDIAPTLLELAGLPIPERMQGRSLLPILAGRADPDEHRDFVRSEYHDALPLPDGTMATMYRDRRWKLVVYHSHGFGELFDLQVDPHEFENLWDDPACQAVREDLLLKSYDASVMAMDWGPPLVQKYEDRPAFRRPLGRWGRR